MNNNASWLRYSAKNLYEDKIITQEEYLKIIKKINEKEYAEIINGS